MGMNDDDSYGSNHNRYDLADEDKLSVNLDDVIDDEEPLDLNAEGPEEEQKQVQADLSDSRSGKGTNQSTGSSGASSGNLFAVGQSKDKGLADMETGSEVYMSELLVS